jgi:hypothetical protein
VRRPDRRKLTASSRDYFSNHTPKETRVPYTHNASLKAKLAKLEAAMIAAKEAARKAATERSPLVKLVRDLQRNLERAQASRHKMIHGNGVCIPTDEFTAQRIHGHRWRETAARIAELKSKLLDAEIALALFDNEEYT